MATGNRRDVELGIGVNVTGSGDVKSLAVDIREIGNAAGQSTPELDKLGAELAQLTEQTETRRKAEAAARSEADAARVALEQQRDELAKLRAETDATSKKTAEYRDKELALKVAVIDAGAALRTKRADVAAAATESIKAVAAEAKLAEQIKETARIAGLAGKSLAEAFSQTGARSTAAIEAELRDIDQALNRIAQDTRTTGADFDRAFAASRVRVEQLKAELAGVSPTIDKAARSTSLLSDGIRQAAVYFSALAVGSQFVDANTQLESLRRTLVLVTGSTDAAAKQIDFLRKTADNAGVGVGTITQAFSKFVASAGAAGISLDTVNRTFAAVTLAAGNLGLSSDETSAALLALGQSASKGKVSMEELGQQLGDRLPAVLATTAKGLGITTAEMIKLIQSGELLADNSFFNAFAKGVEETFVKGSTKVAGFRAELGRLKNAYNEFLTSLGDSGVLSALTATLQLLGPIVVGIGAAFITLGKTIGTAAAAVVDLTGKLLTVDFTGLVVGLRQGRDAARELADELGKHLPDAARYLDLFGVRSKAAADGTAALGDASKTAAGKVNEVAGAAAGAAKSQTDLATASAQSGAAASVAADRWVSLTVAYNKLINSAEKAVESSIKLEKAKKTEGAASVALAELAGNEVRTREAVSAAADGNLKAIQAVASARQSEADLTQIKIGALRQEAIDTGTLTDARKKELVELEQKLTLLRAESVASNEAADAARIEATTRALAIQLVKDNSGALAELKAAYEFERNALAVVTLEEQKGVASKEDLQTATRRAAAAEALYHDALDDTSSAIARKIERQKLTLDVTQATLNLEKASLQSQLDLATLTGKDTVALDARVRLKQVEIKIIEAKIEATKLEAQATLTKADADKAALEAEGKLTDATRLAIDAAIANAKVKLLEAEASGQQLKVLQQQIDNLRAYGDESGKARDKSKAATDGESAALDKNSTAQDRNTVSRQKNLAAVLAQNAGNIGGNYNDTVKSNSTPNKYNAQGVAVDASGQPILIQGQLNIPDGSFFDKAAFDAADAAFGRATQGLTSFGGLKAPNPQDFVKPTGITTDTGMTAVAAELARIAPYIALQNGSASGTSLFGSQAPAPAPKPAPAPAPTSAPLQTVVINMDGVGSVSVQTSQATLLQAMLQQLYDSARSAGYSP